jgi:hypothetical protein
LIFSFFFKVSRGFTMVDNNIFYNSNQHHTNDSQIGFFQQVFSLGGNHQNSTTLWMRLIRLVLMILKNLSKTISLIMSFLLHFHKHRQYLSKRTLSNYKEYYESKNRQILIIISYLLKLLFFYLYINYHL